jgi:PKD repeat protein
MKKTFVLFFIFFAGFLFSTTIHVPQQFARIQNAINAASNGDTVLVHNGIYRGYGNTNLVFYGKSIYLKSVNGYEHTFIDGQNTTRCVNFIYGEGNDTVIEGFTIENGYDEDYAGGIYCEDSSPTITGNFIYNCVGGNYGAGITLSNSDAIFYGNIIGSNQCPEESDKNGEKVLGYGGGMAIINGSNPMLYYLLIINNYADLGGAIYIDDSSTVYITNNTIYNNKSIISSGGILLKHNSVLTCENSIIGGNEGGNTDQITTLTGSSANVTYSDIEGGYTGTGNINGDPLLVDPSDGAGPSYTIMGTDWHLQPDSPCIDTGDPTDSYDDDNSVKDMGVLYYHHEADFSYDSSFGYVSHTVNFTNESIGEASLVSWDFDSDGTWDAYGEHPSYTYTSSGVYSVTMKIENNTWENTKIKENIIVIQENQLNKPENMQISLSGNYAELSWDTVPNATYYLIYASNDPYGEFVYVDTTTDNNYTTDDISSYNKLFFKVIGFDGTREELQKYLSSHQKLITK